MNHSKSAQIIEDPISGERICSCCGYVIEDRMPVGPNLLQSTEDGHYNSKRQHGGLSTLSMHDNNLGSQISSSGFDHAKRRISRDKFKKITTMKLWQHRTRISTPTERRLAYLLIRFKLIGDSIKMSDATKHTTHLVIHKLTKSGRNKGWPSGYCIAACIYVAAKIKGDATIPTGALQQHPLIAKNFTHTKKSRNGLYHTPLLRYIGIVSDVMKLSDAPAYDIYEAKIRLIWSRLGLKPDVYFLAIKILHTVRQMNLILGGKPSLTAGAIIYAILKREQPNIPYQNDIADMIGCTTISIRTHYRKIHTVIELVFTANKLKAGIRTMKTL